VSGPSIVERKRRLRHCEELLKKRAEEKRELVRLLLDVAEFGVTPCTLEAFRKAVGDPEWGP